MMKTLLFVSLLTLRYSIGNAFIISSPHQSNALGISGINNYSSSKVKLFAGKVTEEVQNFKKAQFVASIAEKTGLSKTDSEAALAAVFETITEQVAAGNRVSLNGFGTFKLSHRAAREGRNPQTGEKLKIKASNSPSFTASKVFKEKVNPGR